jgi:hypothetical protein
MEKTIEISGQQVKFKSSGAIPKRYKMQFGRDFFKDLISLGVMNQETGELTEAKQLELASRIDFDVFFDIAWTLAKTADSNISDPLSWLDGFDEFPIMEIIPELQDMIASSISSSKKK